MEKHILGLDLGTNSIGWGVIAINNEGKKTVPEDSRILALGSRIIPMDAAALGDYDKGNAQSAAHERTQKRQARRLIERFKLRRDRLNRVLRQMGFLPPHYMEKLNRYGAILESEEPRIPWFKSVDGRWIFAFHTAFEEMLTEFRMRYPDIGSVPYDWTLYYLRKKALANRIAKYELAWVLHSFNAKRGVRLTREEMSITDTVKKKEEKYYSLRVERVADSCSAGGKKRPLYSIYFENGMVCSYSSKVRPDWEGKVREVIVITQLNPDGTPKCDDKGLPLRSLRAPKEDDWGLVKYRVEEQIRESGKTIGEYIYDALLSDPSLKIRGQLVNTVDRTFYRNELELILKKQAEYHAELRDAPLYEKCAQLLYPYNAGHLNSLKGKDFSHLFIDDILLYQRPLKSKKSLISDCPCEFHTYVDKETGEVCKVPLKCVAVSNPYFQEFRLRKFIGDLKILRRESEENGKIVFNKDVTAEKLDVVREQLYDWLSEQNEITQKALLRKLKLNESDYRWNYVEDKKYPAGQTRALLLKLLKKAGMDKNVLTSDVEMALWHKLYSISHPSQLRSALQKMAQKQGWPDDFVEVFKDCPSFPSGYGSYSEKAIKKLLSLMRSGSSWSEENISADVRARIRLLLGGEENETISEYLREKTKHLSRIEDFSGLPEWLAKYVVYGRHSEASEVAKWSSPADIDLYIRNFKQHSLRNPIVEKILQETLRVVRDIWSEVGHIDEIHVEIGRNMKQTAAEREKSSKIIQENEDTNLRIKALLEEFLNPEYEIEGVKPYSPRHQELMRIYEQQALAEVAESERTEISEIIKKFNKTTPKERPTGTDIMRYKLWLEQKYKSPYTGQTIPLGKLFTAAYEIEHIIPQSVYYDNSQSNKVICEAEVNKLKDRRLGMEFICRHHDEVVTCSGGRQVKVFTADEYKDFVDLHYAKNPAKRRRLLMEEMPEGFTKRQLNDSRYISRAILAPLSNIVRQQDEAGNYEPETVSRNVIVCTGQVTDALKHDWGLGDIWNRIIEPRFRRLNEKSESEDYGYEDIKDGKRFFRITMPFAQQKGFDKKRIDHRHHAMDAVVIACATRNVVNYLNNVSAHESGLATRYDLRRAVCHKTRPDAEGNYQWVVNKPWKTFTEDTHAALEKVVVSFKQSLRVLSKSTNHYRHYDEQKARLVVKCQEMGEHRNIKRSLHKDTVYGEVNLRTVKEAKLSEALKVPQRIVDNKLKAKVFHLLQEGYDSKRMSKYFLENQASFRAIKQSGKSGVLKVAVYVFSSDLGEKRMSATRKSLVSYFADTQADGYVKKIENITDSGIRKILTAYVEKYGGTLEEPFSPEGVEFLNAHVCELNDGRPHMPIRCVRVAEPMGEKFAVGTRGNRKAKFVEADKGCNLFFAVYQQEEGGRTFRTIPLNEAIERQKQKLCVAPEVDDKGNRLLFVLSPNDLAYLPTEEERESSIDLRHIDYSRIYKMVSCTRTQCLFLPHRVAKAIVEGFEYESLNKMERAETGEMIKQVCVPLKADRLGRLSPALMFDTFL